MIILQPPDLFTRGPVLRLEAGEERVVRVAVDFFDNFSVFVASVARLFRHRGPRRDVFHFAHAAILHWSPTFRALIRHKRKSNPDIDEAQDSGRAIVIDDTENSLFRVASGFAVLSTLARTLGIVRWLFVMPVLARMYTDPATTDVLDQQPTDYELVLVDEAFQA